ncbi:MAG: hypothetical protein DCC65_05835 [Planctomycetota bacterium]|nr:MAG: hypothetical protein DCC65_05835 [Planctomycetota bacterium]
MRRAGLNYLVDLLTFVAILALICTGLILEYVLVPGTGGRGGGGGWELWRGTRHDWGDVHFYIAIGLATLLAVHVALHWAWVCALTRRLWDRMPRSHAPARWKENAAGAGFLTGIALVIAAFLFVANASVRRGGAGGTDHSFAGSEVISVHEGRGGGERTEFHLRGSMTLGDIADATGIEPARLRSLLGVPQEVSANARLGRLRNEYGFSMAEARESVAAALSEDQQKRERAP